VRVIFFDFDLTTLLMINHSRLCGKFFDTKIAMRVIKLLGLNLLISKCCLMSLGLKLNLFLVS